MRRAVAALALGALLASTSPAHALPGGHPTPDHDGPLRGVLAAPWAPAPEPSPLGFRPWWTDPATPAPAPDPYVEVALLERAAERAERPLSDDARGTDDPDAYNTSGTAAPLEVAPPPPPPQSPRSIWDDLADCESGNWVNGGASFETGSARWWWAKPGTEVPPWGTTIHHGGLQFHPSTWTAYRSDHHPQYAYDASREQQIEVAERVLAAQGWGAWPTCARKLGLR